MGLLLLLAAILGLVFPPFAIVVMARWFWAYLRRGSLPMQRGKRSRLDAEPGCLALLAPASSMMRGHFMAPQPKKVIDVDCYPILPLPRSQAQDIHAGMEYRHSNPKR